MENPSPGVLRILLQPLGEVQIEVLNELSARLEDIFKGSKCTVSENRLPIPSELYNPRRGQYISTPILNALSKISATSPYTLVLGVADVDLYVQGLNFIFGEARLPGKASIISMHRLSPEFYGHSADPDLFMGRVLKEAVHELGHNLGFTHCSSPRCVMYFSNSISDTDRKDASFCHRCEAKLKSG